MDANTAQRNVQTQIAMVQNMVRGFPMPCACYETILDGQGTICDFRVVAINERFETLGKVGGQSAVGRSVTEVFGPMNQLAVHHLIRLGNEAFASEEKKGQAHISAFHYLYKTTFFFVSDTLVISVYEDLQQQFIRKYFRQSIPHDLIERSIAERNRRPSAPLFRKDCEEPPRSAVLSGAGHKLLEVMPQCMDFSEPGDAVFRDSLTGLYDRFFTMEAIKMYLERRAFPLYIVLGDVNGLGAINDAFGYEAGDELLIRIAKLLRHRCREDDIVARWSDDSMLMVLPYAEHWGIQRLLNGLQSDLDALNRDAGVSVTLGYASCERLPRKAEELIREAEKWTYRKKLLIDQSHRSSIIRLLLTTLHERSADTKEHSDRLANDCRRIGEALGLSAETIGDLLLLAMLHDIGKIGIPDHILNKPGALTPEERHVIERHPAIGQRIAQTAPELTQVAEYILSHHERWDGAGYPNGLRGEQIPIPSRILAVVDAYDVMVTGRSYQPARSHAEAAAELRRCAGTQFDPNVVDVYLGLLAEAEHVE